MRDSVVESGVEGVCGDCSVGLSGPEEDDDDSERGLTPARDQHTLY